MALRCGIIAGVAIACRSEAEPQGGVGPWARGRGKLVDRWGGSAGRRGGTVGRWGGAARWGGGMGHVTCCRAAAWQGMEARSAREAQGAARRLRAAG